MANKGQAHKKKIAKFAERHPEGRKQWAAQKAYIKAQRNTSHKPIRRKVIKQP